MSDCSRWMDQAFHLRHSLYILRSLPVRIPNLQQNRQPTFQPRIPNPTSALQPHDHSMVVNQRKLSGYSFLSRYHQLIHFFLCNRNVSKLYLRFVKKTTLLCNAKSQLGNTIHTSDL